MANDILAKVLMTTQLDSAMEQDSYTLYGYKNYIAIRSNARAPNAGGEVHLIVEGSPTTDIANATALSVIYDSAPVGSIIFWTNGGSGHDNNTWHGKETSGSTAIAPFTLGTRV